MSTSLHTDGGDGRGAEGKNISVCEYRRVNLGWLNYKIVSYKTRMLQEVSLDKCTVCRVMGINRTKLGLKGLFCVLQAFFGVDTFAKMSYGWGYDTDGEVVRA